ncbi:hypothetical protein [Flavihumibacter petaseus]|uniref:hypothetical protein n=1 Tax=Flavihumibacter petaseus TaxID=549295 RepID=UPI00061D1A67|nr:hypothetical protein [Flavihumibacter petaseus]
MKAPGVPPKPDGSAPLLWLLVPLNSVTVVVKLIFAWLSGCKFSASNDQYFRFLVTGSCFDSPLLFLFRSVWQLPYLPDWFKMPIGVGWTARPEPDEEVYLQFQHNRTRL